MRKKREGCHVGRTHNPKTGRILDTIEGRAYRALVRSWQTAGDLVRSARTTSPHRAVYGVKENGHTVVVRPRVTRTGTYLEYRVEADR